MFKHAVELLVGQPVRGGRQGALDDVQHRVVNQLAVLGRRPGIEVLEDLLIWQSPAI